MLKRDQPSEGASQFRLRVHMAPKKDSILLLRNLVKMAQGSEVQTLQEFKSNAQISFKYLFRLALQPPKTKSLEPTTVMVWW